MIGWNIRNSKDIELYDQRDRLSLSIAFVRWALRWEVGSAALYYSSADCFKRHRAIFSIQSADLLGRRMYITLCSAMLGNRERIVDSRWGYRVARSRNEICVTRGPTSPGLALLLLSSAQPGAVQFCSRRVARYIIQLCHSSYTHGPAKVRRGQRANRSNANRGKETGRRRPLLFLLRTGNAVFVSKCGSVSCFKGAAIMKL